MSLQIASDVEELLRSFVATGEYPDESAVLRDALGLLRARSRLREDLITGIEELDRGEWIDAEDVFRELDEKASHLAGTDR